MTRYVSEPVDADSASIRTIIEASLAAAIPGIQIPAGSLLDFLVDTFSNTSAQDRQLLTEVLAIIFRYSGEKIDRVPQRDPVAATGFTTWTRTAADAAAARTVQLGTEITLDGLDGTPVAFQTTADFTFVAPAAVAGATIANPSVITTAAPHGLASGQTVVIAGAGGATAVNGTFIATVLTATTFSVPVNNTNAWTSGGTVSHTGTAAASVGVAANVPGADGNLLQTNPQPAQTSPWLASITVSAPTSGGVDAEEDDAYLDRLADTRPLRATTLLLPDDFGRFARNQAGVDRALILDNFNGASTQSGHITVIPIDASGAALSSGAMTALLALIVASTATNLAVHVQAPVYTTITVIYAAKALAGWDTADVKARGDQAVKDFLNRALWGRPQSGDGRGWVDTPVVHFQDLVTALNNVEGLDYYPESTANTTSGSANLTSVSTTTGWVNGMPVAGPNIPAGTTILSGAGTATMVMSANASATAAGVRIAALSLNGSTADVTMTGPGALPAAFPPSSVTSTVT